MKLNLTFIAITLMALLTSCQAIAGIFKAGMGFGIFLVVFVVGLIAFLLLKARKK